MVKHVVRYAVIAGLVGGAAALAIGPEGRARVGALFTQTRDNINQAIDAQIGDPIALRAQLKSLEAEYPERIAGVQQDLAEVREQIAQLRREAEISEKVVSLARQDLEKITSLIQRGHEAQHASFANGQAAVVRVVFQNASVDLEDATGKANQIQQVQAAYAQRAADIQRDLGYLATQEQRLAQLLDQLQTEHAQFQAQLWQMDRQVETIARNDRLIEVMQRRQRTIDEQSRYRADSLTQVASRLAAIRGKQEATLEALGTATNTVNYEDRARLELQTRALPAPAPTPTSSFQVPPSVIEIRPDHADDPASDEPTAGTTQPSALKPIVIRD